MEPLPEFVPPMLAKLGEPFSSDEYQFEIKWDGTRALAFVEGGDYRLINRRQNPSKLRYPELSYLGELPAGTLLDGEIVVLVDGKPDFAGMLRREQVRTERRAQQLARELPAVYVVFDLLYRGGQSIMNEPLTSRREQLGDLLADSPAIFSEGVESEGLAYFEMACEQELEGVVAKRLSSRYRPGVRSDAWIKIKRRNHLYCVIIGYLPEGSSAVRSLAVATEVDGVLRSVGRVGSGLTDALRSELFEKLSARTRPDPVVKAAGGDAVWVEPEVFCTVSYLEFTGGGDLRAPVFEALISA